MTRLTRRILLAGSVALLALATAASAQDTTLLRLGWTTSDGEKDPYAIGARAFKAQVEARSAGRITVELFPNRALGDERAMIDGMRIGTIEAGIITNAVIAQIEPAFQINDMPFLFKDEAQARAVLDGPVGASLAELLDGRGVVALGYMEGGFRHMINNQKPVNAPADVAGVKYRVLQSPVYIEMFTSLGGTAVPIAWGETFTAVQQGAVDGLEIPLAVIDQNKYDEVTEYLSLTNHIYSMIGLVISKTTLSAMPDDLQQVVREAAAAATATQREAAGTNAAALVQTLADKGMTVNAVADLGPFRVAVQPMYESFKGQIGAEIVAEALAAVQ